MIQSLVLTPRQCVDILGDDGRVVLVTCIRVFACRPAQAFLKEKGTVLWSMDLNGSGMASCTMINPMWMYLNRLVLHVSTHGGGVHAQVLYFQRGDKRQCALDAYSDCLTKELPVVYI